MPPYQYQPYHNPYVATTAELLEKKGEIAARQAEAIGAIQARAAEQQGNIWGNAIGNIGSIIANVPQQMQAQKDLALRRQATQQQLASGAITLKEQQKKLEDDETMARIYQGAYGLAPSQQPGFQGPTQPGTPPAGSVPLGPDGLPPGLEKDANGVVTIKPTFLTQAMAEAGMGDKIPGVIAGLTAYQEKAASLKKLHGEIAVQTRDALGSLGATVEAAGNTPQAFHMAAMLGVHNGQFQPDQVQPFLDQIDANPALVGAITKALQTGSAKQTELNTARTTADARVQTAKTAADRLQVEYPGLDAKAQEGARTNAAGILGAAQSQQEYAAALNALPHALARQFPAAETWTPKTVDAVRQLGMTPDQQATTTATATAHAETLRHNHFEEYLAGLRNKREDAKFQATFGSGLGEDGKPLAPEAIRAAAEANPAAKMIAEYQIAPPSTRNLADPKNIFLLKQVQALNPDYDASQFSVRAPTRRAFTTGTQGQQITAMNTAIEHLHQLDQAAQALGNGTFRPGNAAYNYLATEFGSSMPTNFDGIKGAVASELSSIAAKGAATVSGIKEQESAIASKNSPKQLSDYIDTQISLMGSKLNALDYQFHKAMGAKDPFEALTPQAKEILVSRGFDPKNPAVRIGFPDLSGLKAGEGRTFKNGPYAGQMWTIGADGKPKKVGG